jgi:predicted anti-sigma-YlaC factor YlaD
MTDQWNERLSEYLDGDLPAADRAALEAHLAACGECTETLASLRRVVAHARALEDRPPATDLWPEIAAAVGARRPLGRTRRFTFSLSQLAAAGIALVAASGATAWLLHPGSSRAPVAAAPAAQTQVRTAAARTYDGAVADLERLLAEGRGKLDTATVRVLEENLATIDRAIAQAERAVAADSANLYLNSHLAATMRRKLDLLRQAAALVATVS